MALVLGTSGNSFRSHEGLGRGVCEQAMISFPFDVTGKVNE